MSATTVTSLDGVHTTSTTRRADELARALFDAVNPEGQVRIDELTERGCLSHGVHGTRTRDAFASVLAIRPGAMPGGRAIHTHMVAENDRVASRSVRDGTVAVSGQAPDFRTLDLSRIGDGSVSRYRFYIDIYPVHE
jgi:ketosteroid isomerase-like protein